MPTQVNPTEIGMQPLLDYYNWKKQRYAGGGDTSQWGYNQYVQQWQTTYQAKSQAAIAANPQQYETPAEAAQRMSEGNWVEGLAALEQNRSMYAGLGQPGDPYTQALINPEMEYNAAVANRGMNTARDAAGASGLGAGGGLTTVERLIREDMDRANIRAMRDIRTGVQGEGRAGVATANQNVAQGFWNRSFELPESGSGAAWNPGYSSYGWAYGPGATGAAPTPTTASAPVRWPTTPFPRSTTVRR